MENEISRLHYGGYGSTVIHPVVLVAILIAAVLIFFLKRKNIIVLILFLGIFIPMSQRIVIAGLDFMILRILILFGWIRIIMSSEHRSLKLNAIDKALILYVLSNVVGYTLLWQTGGAFINRLGFAYNALGIYFLFRILIRDFEDIDQVIRILIVISVFVAVCMLIEQINGRNLFAVFGGIPKFTPIRDGRLRSQGPFAHAIVAGMFGATLMPLILSLWWKERQGRTIVLVGIVSSTIITITSASSGPVIAYLAGILGLCTWPLRNHMRKIRWGILFSLITLHMIMKAPVWALIARAGVVGGSSSWHRYNLVNQFIRRFDEWWLFGTKSTAHWGWMMQDTVNQYVSVGVQSGLLSLLLFVAIIVFCFRSIGLKIKTCRSRLIQLRLWAFGAVLFAHVIGFWGISYFDQIILIWYMLLAIISIISDLSISDKGLYAEPQNFLNEQHA